MSNFPCLWRTRHGLPQRTRLDLFETDALINVLVPEGQPTSDLDKAEAARVITKLHDRSEAIECGCQERRPGPTLVPTLAPNGPMLVPQGPPHAHDCVLRVLNPTPAKAAPPLMRVSAPRHPLTAASANPFRLNNLTALI